MSSSKIYKCLQEKNLLGKRTCFCLNVDNTNPKWKDSVNVTRSGNNENNKRKKCHERACLQKCKFQRWWWFITEKRSVGLRGAHASKKGLVERTKEKNRDLPTSVTWQLINLAHAKMRRETVTSTFSHFSLTQSRLLCWVENDEWVQELKMKSFCS